MATLDFSDLTSSGQSSTNNKTTLNFDDLTSSTSSQNNSTLDFSDLTSTSNSGVVDSTFNLPGYEEETLADKVAFATRLGVTDTYRGVKQLFKIDKEQMEEEQKRLNRYIQDPEYGGTILAAYTAGLFGDPVGWAIPGMKAKNAWSAAKAGMLLGLVTTPLGYVDHEAGQTRWTNTAFGVAGGGALSPAMHKFSHTLLPAMKKGYGNIGKAIDDGNIHNELNILQKSIATPLAPVYQGAKKVGTKVKESKFGQGFGKYFIDNFGLPEQYVKLKKFKRMSENEWASKFDNVLAKYSKLTDEQDALLYRVLTGEKSKLPANMKGLNDEGRKLVDDIGQELIDLGILGKKTYAKNKGKYLYRSYEKTSGPFKKDLIREENQMRVFGSEFMRRGKTIEIDLKDLPKYLRGTSGDGKGWRQVGSKNTKKKTVKVNRDWTKAERKKNGEIVSAAYAMAKTGKLMTRDMTTFKFFDDVSKLKVNGSQVARKTPPMIKNADGKLVPDSDWVRMPNSSIPNSGGVKEYGALANKWVSKEIYNDLKWANTFRKWERGDSFGGFGKVHHKMLQYWKRTKTSLNPVVHMNNIMSNHVLYDLVDGDWRHLGRAGRDFYNAKVGITHKGINKAESEDFAKAKALGVFDADVMKRELTNAERDIYKKYMRGKEKVDGGLPDRLWNGFKAIGRYANKTHIDTLYGHEDNVFRLALFKDHLAKNVRKGAKPSDDNYKEAALFARKYMLDYEIDAPGVNILRESILPFLSYTYRVAPILAETAIKRPWKLAKWGLIMQGANAIGVDVSVDDYATERKRLKELNMGYDLLGETVLPGAHTMIKVPRTDKSQYLDVSRWVPGGDVLDLRTSGMDIPYVPAPLQPSGAAIGGIYKAMTGFDTYTGKKVPGIESGVFEDSSSARLSILGKEFVPMYHQVSKIKNAMASDGKRHPTKDDVSVGEAFLNAVGFKLKNYDETKYKTRVGYKYKNRMSSLAAKGRKILADYQGGRVSKEKYKRQIERITKELKIIEAEARKAMKKAK